ncbi:UvrD-helicase domain-containing protein [Alphaproteobacteria bacterium]|nr:UvrD-helicase domain-containing protein [Alphaproteobacteria bacterium]
MVEFTDTLNIAQKDAVDYMEGPLIVLAGAGTGKTKVLTTKLSKIIIDRLASPYEILTVTFTNKAANEMKNRIENILKLSTAGWWIGTFHSMGARILRKNPEIIGLKKQFTIIDTDDQLRLLKQVLSYHNIDEKRWPARNLNFVIQRWKDKGFNPTNIDTIGSDFGNNKGAKLYETYQTRLKTLNAVDYGDLLLQNLNIFKKEPELLAFYQNKFKYILVDEYQDTNLCQYDWLKKISTNENKMCVVGDDDQSIYSWRGAEAANLLKFEKDYPKVKVIKLEKNYRSKGNILKAANFLISKNNSRMGKKLWTDEDDGNKIEIKNTSNSEEEAIFISDTIEELKRSGQELNSCAILVRASYQTRSFEDRFIKIGLPYKIIGGTKFYERLEIRDAMAFFRLTVSDFDDLAFERIVNVPRKGLGEKSIRSIELYARENKISLIQAASILVNKKIFTPKTNTSLSNFLKLILKWRSQISMNASDLAEIILDESGYTTMWQNDKSIEAEGRLENLKELVSAISEFENIRSFLEHIQLVMDNETNNTNNSVKILTLHAAKGLEYKNIFLPGWEEEVFPNKRALEERQNEGLEEERRLAYVGITRARERLWITHANSRVIHGQWYYSIPSRFIEELPKENIIINGFNFNSEENNTYIEYNNDYTNQSKPVQFQEKKIRIGQRVFHQKFGYGNIISIEGENIEVNFNKTNIKKVKIEYLMTDV